MESFIQVLIDASSSFSWWHWLLGLGVAVLSGGFGMGIVFAIKEFKICDYFSLILLVFAIIMLGLAYLCATPFLNYPETEVQITIISWSVLWFLIGLNMPIINKDSND
ncbi:MAG: hypothetical protein IKC10_01655 [Alphaproteobacteria bacterium]|nr:hypothetical protein [Alphaproteobacteria bacterium]